MGGRRRGYLVALGVVALTVVVVSPTSSVAGIKCKRVAVTGAALSSDQATRSWSLQVRRAYGAAWANFGIARGRSESQTALPAATMYFITATPCRRT